MEDNLRVTAWFSAILAGAFIIGFFLLTHTVGFYYKQGLEVTELLQITNRQAEEITLLKKRLAGLEQFQNLITWELYSPGAYKDILP